jgi:hypothetical protein
MPVSDYCLSCPSCPSCPNPPKLKSNGSRTGSSILPSHPSIFSRGIPASAALSSYVNQGFRAQRNALESPLLRLPPEVRNVIWTFAVGVDLVFIRQKSKCPLRAKGYGVSFDGEMRRFEEDRQLSAFHLPEVCRQIYAETATLAYSTNTFLLYGTEWIRALSLTQRRAISRVELVGFQNYLFDYECRRSAASLKNKGLVRLTHCHVSIGVQKLAKMNLCGRYLRLSKDRQSWVRLITDAVKFQEGQHMVVEVE